MWLASDSSHPLMSLCNNGSSPVGLQRELLSYMGNEIQTNSFDHGYDLQIEDFFTKGFQCKQPVAVDFEILAPAELKHDKASCSGI